MPHGGHHHHHHHHNHGGLGAGFGFEVGAALALGVAGAAAVAAAGCSCGRRCHGGRCLYVQQPFLQPAYVGGPPPVMYAPQQPYVVSQPYAVAQPYGSATQMYGQAPVAYAPGGFAPQQQGYQQGYAPQVGQGQTYAQPQFVQQQGAPSQGFGQPTYDQQQQPQPPQQQQQQQQQYQAPSGGLATGYPAQPSAPPLPQGSTPVYTAKVEPPPEKTMSWTI